MALVSGPGLFSMSPDCNSKERMVWKHSIEIATQHCGLSSCIKKYLFFKRKDWFTNLHKQVERMSAFWHRDRAHHDVVSKCYVISKCHAWGVTLLRYTRRSRDGDVMHVSNNPHPSLICLVYDLVDNQKEKISSVFHLVSLCILCVCIARTLNA